MNRRTRVYVAGPYTKGYVALNVRSAMLAAHELMNLGYAPFVPHFTYFQHMLRPRPYEDWIEHDNQFLPCCDVLLRLPGDSKSADKEVRLAKSLGIRVFSSVDGLHEVTSNLKIGTTDQDARDARRAILTGHGRLVEDLADHFNRAVESDDLPGFFERIAARLSSSESDVRRSLKAAHHALDPIKDEALRNIIAKYLRGD